MFYGSKQAADSDEGAAMETAADAGDHSETAWLDSLTQRETAQLLQALIHSGVASSCFLQHLHQKLTGSSDWDLISDSSCETGPREADAELDVESTSHMAMIERNMNQAIRSENAQMQRKIRWMKKLERALVEDFLPDRADAAESFIECREVKALASVEDAVVQCSHLAPELRKVKPLLQTLTTHGAAEAQKVISKALHLSFNAEEQKTIVKADRHVRYILLLRCQASCNNAQDRDEFFIRMLEAYSYGVSKSVRMQLLFAYHKLRHLGGKVEAIP